MNFALGYAFSFWASMLALAEGRWVIALALFVLGQFAVWSFFWGGERS